MRHETCCFDLADPTSQIDFKKTDNTPLKPEECSDEELPPVAEPAKKGVTGNIKEEPAEVEGSVGVPTVPQMEPQQEYMYILQEEATENVVGDWTTLENVSQVARAADGTVVVQGEEGAVQAPMAIMPEQEFVSETMIVEPGEAGAETMGIDSQELLKLCGNEFGEFPPGTEILVYMDGTKGGEATKIQVLQQ